MGNPLLERLQKNDKKGHFVKSQTSVSYRTGFTPLDYRNGHMVEVRGDNDELIKRYASTGLVGGSFVTIVGKSGTAKTAFAIQAGSNIIRPYDAGLMIHYDLEQATDYTRIRRLSGFNQIDLRNKVVHKREELSIDDIYESIVEIAKMKRENRDDFSYDTGLLNEFGEPIISLQPTVALIDSIPTLAKSGEKDEMQGDTYANRVAKAISQFYKLLTPIIKAANIIVIAINHINAKIDINPFAKSQPQLNYLKQDETLPGGNAPIYYAHNLFKFVTNGKYIVDTTTATYKAGFDGFRVRCELLKSRTNKAGQYCLLAYNQVNGFDPAYTMYEFLDDNKMLGGTRNNAKHVVGFPEITFDKFKFTKQFLERPELRRVVFEATLPVLEAQLSRSPEDSELLNFADLYEQENPDGIDMEKEAV